MIDTIDIKIPKFKDFSEGSMPYRAPEEKDKIKKPKKDKEKKDKPKQIPED